MIDEKKRIRKNIDHFLKSYDLNKDYYFDRFNQTELSEIEVLFLNIHEKLLLKELRYFEKDCKQSEE